VVHEKPRVVEPHRLLGAGPEVTGHEVDGPAVEARVGRAVVLVMAVVVVDEQRMAAAARGVAPDVVDRAGGRGRGRRIAILRPRRRWGKVGG
jgi:hypothetical protein